MRSVLILAAAVLIGTVAAGQNIELDRGVFRATGIKSGTARPPEDTLRVYAGDGDIQPMLGSYASEATGLVFRPRFPLVPGTRYRAIFTPESGTPIERFFELPRPEAAQAARVEYIYPSTNILPANQLKLYIQFSAPMSRGEAYQRIHLMDELGKPIPLAFVEIDQELWDANNQRLTVLFDPGRIKRGLVPNQELGSPIVEGKKYTLVIDKAWKDAHGIALAAGFQKQFQGAAADREPPDPKNWRITIPKAATMDPIIIDFPDPMDFALLHRMLELFSAENVRLVGEITVDRDETQWRFTPAQPWGPGDYRLIVDTALEDLAGNHVGRAFDVDTFAPASELATKKTVTIPLVIR